MNNYTKDLTKLLIKQVFNVCIFITGGMLMVRSGKSITEAFNQTNGIIHEVQNVTASAK